MLREFKQRERKIEERIARTRVSESSWTIAAAAAAANASSPRAYSYYPHNVPIV
uniref:Uncharacterized protein n=1 Tax=Rhizophora mucronata TaxID=61149 RepID=A0A2P2PSU9_RHIMU